MTPLINSMNLHIPGGAVHMAPEGSAPTFASKSIDPAYELMTYSFQRLTYLQRIEIQECIGAEDGKILDGWQTRKGGLVITLQNCSGFLRVPELPSIHLHARSKTGYPRLFDLKVVNIPERSEMTAREYQLAIAERIDERMRAVISNWCRYFASKPKILKRTYFDEVWVEVERQLETNASYFRTR